MESYHVVDIKNFDRAEYFAYFMDAATVIELTAKVDVTAALQICRKESVRFQALMLFKLFTAINKIRNFRYDIYQGKLIEWEKIVPTFSSFSQKSKLFSTLYAEPAGNYLDFNRRYIKTAEKYADAGSLLPQGILPPNVFNVSCIPWVHFEHFSSNFRSNDNRIVKMISLGKYQEIDGKCMMPLTLQVSHAIVDGYHAALFFEELQKELLLP